MRSAILQTLIALSQVAPSCNFGLPGRTAAAGGGQRRGPCPLALIERRIRLSRRILPIVGGDPPWFMLRRFCRVCHQCKARPLSPASMAAGCRRKGGCWRCAKIERRLGLADRLANCLTDPRAPERV